MDRKDFLRKSILGAASLATGITAVKGLSGNPPADAVGFNHLPPVKSQLMDNIVLHRAETRGHADHGWLNTYHTFSFAGYHHPERMRFGALRVLNDDTVSAGMGFGTHPHDNMEIISIPLDGDLEHQDSMGNVAVIKQGDIQVMSAGTGITHSEYNKNGDRPVKFLQIWVYPRERSVKPRYDQITLDISARHNKLQQILSPIPDDDGVWIHQDAWFHLGRFDQGKTTEYALKQKGNGVYAFVISGSFSVNGQALEKRDGLGAWDIDKLEIRANSPDAEILLMEVPMYA